MPARPLLTAAAKLRQLTPSPTAIKRPKPTTNTTQLFFLMNSIAIPLLGSFSVHQRSL
jgi:hypothetical protein